jgi:hypothetical protein
VLLLLLLLRGTFRPLLRTFWPARSVRSDSALRWAWAKFVHGDFSVVIAVELSQGLGRLLNFLFIDDAVVVGIEDRDQRGSKAATLAGAEVSAIGTAGRSFATGRRGILGDDRDRADPHKERDKCR